MRNVTDSLKRKKLADLYDYLNRNQAYLINYQEREQQDTLTRVKWLNHIESIINARHNKRNAMDLGREHIMFSKLEARLPANEWGKHWQEPVPSALGVIA